MSFSLQDKAADIARCLNALTPAAPDSERWAVGPLPEGTDPGVHALLTRPDGRGLKMIHYVRDKEISFRGVYPRDAADREWCGRAPVVNARQLSDEPPRASVGRDRPAEAIARDLTKRMLTRYLPLYAAGAEAASDALRRLNKGPAAT